MTKRRPLGQPLQLTDEQLDQLADITDQDVMEAMLDARANGPKLARFLAAGTEVDGQIMPPAASIQGTDDGDNRQ